MKLKKDLSELPLDDPRRRRLPILLRKAWYSLNQTFRRRIAHTGLTPDQFTLLRTLTESDGQGLSQRELAARISSDPNTVSSLLRRMERAGLVERRSHEADRRAFRIVLTAKGSQSYAQARLIALDLQTTALGAIPEAQRETFLGHLEELAKAVQGKSGRA